MTYELILGDRAYSSWSLRGWLLFEKFGLKAKSTYVDFSAAGHFKPQTVGEQLADMNLAPARTVPTLITPEGALIWDSLAMDEELATRHPEAGHWPADPKLRATARTLAAEMHSSFGALRNDCPMNLRCAYSSYVPPEDVAADVARLNQIFAYALDMSGGPWLCGDYSIADVFFAPVAGRIAGYGLTMTGAARGYIDTQLADLVFRRWRAMGLVKGPDLPWYARDYDQTTWPGPQPLAARAVDSGTPENDTCPYSGDPVTHLMELEGRIFGFCNAFCRDKTVADPAAWPAFMEIYQS